MRSNWQLKFGVGFLMFAMLVIAGYFYGLNRGETVRYNTKLSTKTYSLSSLLNSDQPIDDQIETIANLIRESIAPDSWLERGGIATLTVYNSNRSLVVHQFGTEHNRIKELLESLEQLANEKVRIVEYDISTIIDRDAQKPVDGQVEAICGLINKTFASHGDLQVRLTPEPNKEVIVVSARGQMHTVLAAYFEQLRFARKAISEIDS